ncbi:MAG: septum formation protein Maf [Clostridia bacterium]|nr:septum formation protein Maf [Clostridia bacterium]
MEWILASASPRRKELLKNLIENFAILPAQGEEQAEENLAPQELVCALATAKATEVAQRKEAGGKAVIGSDTVVAYNGEILGKPKSVEDAARMLRMLSGNIHQVYTGVCVVLPNGEKRVFFDVTSVHFYPLTEEFIFEYVAGGSPMDKAGAYGIQDGGLVERIEGSYSNVVGFPVEKFAKFLQTL